MKSLIQMHLPVVVQPFKTSIRSLGFWNQLKYLATAAAVVTQAVERPEKGPLLKVQLYWREFDSQSGPLVVGKYNNPSCAICGEKHENKDEQAKYPTV